MTARTLGKISLSVLLVISLMVPTALPFSARYAEAQSASGGVGGSVSTGFNAGGIIATAISCSGIVDKLASAISSLFSVTEVPVGDAGLRTKEECMDALVHQLVVMILDKITLATVDWINSGFEGQPLYLADPKQFFTNIAQDEINRVTGWFGCTTGSVTCGEDYPFGQLVMGSIITAIQSQLAANVRFSLNQVLAHGTYEEYKVDFNVGGWAGYTAFMEPNNNPFGNNILVNRELGRRIGGTSVSIAGGFKEDLAQSGGFLNQRRCAMTQTGNVSDEYIKTTDPLHHEGPLLADGELLSPDLVASLSSALQDHILANSSTPEEAADEYNTIVLRSNCTQWKTTTPGNIVSSKITTALNISDNKLIQADEISESLGLIFDALINQLVGSGLESLSSFASTDGGGGGSTSVLLQQVNGQQPGQIENGQVPPPPVDSVTGTGYVDTPAVAVQQQYITAANQALPILTNLIQKIRALDYCVPGPNPNWLDDAEDNFQAAMQSVMPFSSGDPDPQDAEDANQDYYAAAINTMTGITITPSVGMHNHTQFTEFMNNLFAKYSAKMQDTADLGYNRFLAPPATRILLQGLLEDSTIYETSYTNLSTYLVNIPSYMPTLLAIEQAFDQLIQNDPDGVLDPTDPAVAAQISLFNSISDHLATQDQLALLNSNIPYFTSQENIVNGHLTSCLNETVNNPYSPPNKRVQYPMTIFPTYNQSAAGITGTIPQFDTAFLPGVDFSDNTNGGDIDVSIPGVNIVGTEPLTIFETVLQSVY